MFTTGELTDQTDEEKPLWAGLDRFGHFPEWLATAGDPDRTRRLFSQRIPEFSSGRLSLEKSDPGHYRYKKDYWTGLFKLTVNGLTGGQPKEITLQGTVFPPGTARPAQGISEGTFGSEDWHVYLPDAGIDLRPEQPETVLGAMEYLVDPEKARQFLTQAIRQGYPEYRDIEIQKVIPHVVRYKPGSRCTIVYGLEYASGQREAHAWPERVVGKTYSGEKGHIAHDSMAALWNSPLRNSGTVKIAPPLAFLPEKRVLIQGALPEEQTLQDLIRSAIRTGSAEKMEQVREFMRKTAAGLAGLHRSGVMLGETWTWEDERSEVTERIEHIASAVPDLATAADGLIHRLTALAATVPPDPTVPTHGSFRPAQVLLSQGQIGFIDFDSFRQSEPADDIALFISTVLSLSVNNRRESPDLNWPAERGKQFEQLYAISEEFIDEYQKHLPASRERIALWVTLDLLMILIHCWLKIRVFEVDDTLFGLEEYLRAAGIARGNER